MSNEFGDDPVTATNEFGDVAVAEAPARPDLMKVESLFGGVDKFDKTLDPGALNELNSSLAGHTDQAKAKMRVANQIFLADRLGKPVEDVSRFYEQYKGEYARKVLKDDQPGDDATFYGKVGTHIQKEQGERSMLQEMAVGLFEAAREGKDFNATYASEAALRRATPTWQSDKSDLYRQWAKDRWDGFQAKKEQLSGAIDAVGQYLTAAKMRPDPATADEHFALVQQQKAKVLDLLSKLSPEDAEAAMGFASFSATKTEEPDRGFGEKAAGRFTRGMDSLLEGAGDTVIETVRAQANKNAAQFPSVGLFQELSDKANASRERSKLERHLQSYLTGEVDPMKSQNWIANGLLSSAESMPYMLAAMTPAGAAVTLSANMADIRGKYEDQGMSPGTALALSVAAAPAYTAVDFIQSKMIFAGKLPGLERFLEAPVRGALKFAGKTSLIAGAEFTEQLGQELFQDAIPPMVQSLASHLSDAVPTVDWQKELEALKASTPETAAGLLPLVLVGTATASFKDRAYAREFFKREDSLRAVGFKPEAIAEIQAAETPEEAARSIKANWNDREIGSEAQKTALADLNAQAISIREQMGQTFSAEQKALFAKYPEFNSLPTNQYPVEVRKADGTIYPAVFSGYWELGDKTPASIGRMVAGSWSHGMLLDSEKILTAVPSPAEWAAGIRQAPPVLKPLPEGSKAEYLGRKFQVAEGVGEAVDQWQITFPDDEGRGLTVSAEELKQLGYAAPGLPPGTQAAPEKPPHQVSVTRGDNGSFIVTNGRGEVVGTAQTPEIASQIALEAETPPKPTEVREEGTTALNKEEIGLLRDLYGMDELQAPDRQSFENVLDAAKIEGLSSNAEALADQIIENPRLLTAKEHAAMVLRSAELQNQHEQYLRQAAVEMDLGNVHKGEELRKTAEGILGALDRLTEASDMAGTEIGRALSIRRMRMNRATYELSAIIQRATLAKKDSLTHAQTEELRKLSDSIKEQQQKIDALEATLAEERKKALAAQAETFVHEGRATRAKASKEANQLRRLQLKKEIQEMGYRVNDITSSIGQGAKVASIVARLARTYIEDGAATLSEVSAKLKEDIPDLTEQDIFNSLGGRIKAESKRVETEAKARIRELKKQANLWAKVYDKLNDVAKMEGPVQKSSEEVAAIRALLGQLRLQADRVVRDDDKALKAIHEKISKVQDQLAGGFRLLPEKEAEAKANADLEAARGTLEDLRKEMGMVDQISELEELIRTGAKPEKKATKEETDARLVALREKIDSLRKEIHKRDNPPKAPKTGDELNAERKARLEEKLTQLSAQLEGGFRLIPAEDTRVPDVVEVSALRKQTRELESLMRTEDAIHDLEEQLRTGDFKVSAPENRIIVNAKLQDALVKRQQLQREVNARIEALKPKTVMDRVIDIATLPRAIMATADMSATLRQGLFLSTGRPVTAVRAFGKSLKAFFSQNSADAIDIAIKRHPNQMERLKAGLFLSDLDAVPNRKEEQFVSNLAARIPVFGAVVRGSERSMATTLNLLRTAAFDQFIEGHPEATPEQRKAFAHYVNVASGRGDLGRFNSATKELNAVFFAPRYAVSRFQLLYSPFANIKDPLVRNAILKDYLAYAVTGMSVLTIAALMGAKVGLDPEAPDFGKIILGNTRIDIWGGLQQPVRLLMQPLLAGLDRVGLHQSEKQIDLLDAGRRFMTYKLAPSVTIPATLLTGKNVIGQEQEIPETVIRSIVPLLAQDVVSVYEDTESVPATAAAAGAAFLGAGVSTQKPKK
jgi:t-SNARE complex subunit (syntaxin)